MAGDNNNPLHQLSPEDQSMICTFMLASGSVKDLAEAYGVSYPTMRARLDALIERLRQLMNGKPLDPVNDYLAELIAKGRIMPADAAKIRDLHRQSLTAPPSTSSSQENTT